LARHVAVEGLMASDDPPDVGVLLAEFVNRPAWHPLANCRGADPDLFFPDRADGPPVAALAYCEDCSVRQECLAPALEVAWTTGVWGGTTGAARKGLRRSVAWGACPRQHPNAYTVDESTILANRLSIARSSRSTDSSLAAVTL
jgi:WhiB family redox-sensing transcriptional regulator